MYWGRKREPPESYVTRGFSWCRIVCQCFDKRASAPSTCTEVTRGPASLPPGRDAAVSPACKRCTSAVPFPFHPGHSNPSPSIGGRL